MMKRTFATLATLAILSGCNGEGGNGRLSQIYQEQQQNGTGVGIGGVGGVGGGTQTAPNTIYKKDGIYVNEQDLVVMLVDTDLYWKSVVVGDYTNSAIYVGDFGTVNKNTMQTRGLYYVDLNTYYYEPTTKINYTFTATGANASSVINGQNFAYSFKRAPDSKPLAEIVGTHTNPDDGSTWTINADGSFIVNGECTLSGKFIRVDGYYTAKNTSASGCNDATFNDTNYEARMVTAIHKGTTYLLGVAMNHNKMLWGSAPI
ncbi:hypothetical protein QTU67_001675 [Vibrio cholerae]|uniref:hypothetical protein n=1 Tax=Vibrio cholerae TaxID=666 RepID=UPI000218F32B|nr:hypothetical protein [Vibrio cholerae]EGQ9634887.1 hypothetical protein [Vibrio cholerae]EGQ99465.1 hypothetical protein VCHE39_2359 [Vibrio cholerae HE39]EGR0031254.1 hypothetical protein [Vibrio cholerae]EGR1278873.1 hypothetical protein [Vibrio cholerae]EGR5563515.1 hypothetical protein [Vibrio cholerae]